MKRKIFTALAAFAALALISCSMTTIQENDIEEKNTYLTVGVTVSIGAFLLQPNFNGDLQKAVNNADQALYRAKEGGRNQVVQFQTAEPEPAAV